MAEGMEEDTLMLPVDNLDEEGENEHCHHSPPYPVTRAPTLQDFTSGTNSFPDFLHYYSLMCKCGGTKKDGTPCDYTRIMVNWYLPWMRFPNFKFGQSMWKNPLATRSAADCIRAAETQVYSEWHMFWYAVHHLGAHVSGTQPASPEQEHQWIEWLIVKLQPTKENFDSVKKTFKKAGLLEEGGPGDGEAGVRAKFLLAEEMIKHYDLSSAPKLVKRQGSAGEEEEGASRAQTPPKRARTHFRDDPPPAGGAAGGHAQLVVHGYGGSSQLLVFDESAVLILLYLASLYY